jgi:HK97 family phage major capsid protein
MPRSVKILQEEIDEAELAFNGHRLEAKRIFDQHKSLERDLTGHDKAHFDAAASAANASRQRLDALRKELIQAQDSQRQVLNMSRTPSSLVYNNNFSGDKVLPVNGVLPGEVRPYAPYSRIAKLKAFKSDQEAFDAGMWYKAVVARAFRDTRDERAEEHCRNRGLDILNTAYEGSGAAGGYTVPAPISSAIIEVRERVGVARQVCNVQPMTSDTLSVPKKAGGLTVYVVNEMQAMTPSDKTWSSVAVAAVKRACLSYLSQELSDDALINMVDNLVSEQAYALAEKEDDELINGTGASTYGGITGLLSSIGSAGVYTTPANKDLWTEIVLSDITSTIGKLPDRYHIYEPSFICSHSFWSTVLMNLAFSAGGVTAAEVMGGTANVKSFMGYKVFLTSKMPTATAASTKCLLFGSFSQAVLLGDRGGVRVARSDDFKFAEDLISLKATSRYDMNVHDEGDSSNAGAYVALSTNSA